MRWPLVIAASIALGSCSMANDKGASEQQVAAFHQAYDAQHFEAIYDGSAPTLKQITPKQQFLDFLGTVYRNLGRVKAASQQSWKVNYATGGSGVTLVYETTFANGTGTETFVYETGANPRLLGYHITSQVPLAPTASQVRKNRS